MRKFLQRLKVSHKLMLISIFFMIPDSVLLCLFLVSINANINFARWEKYGNEYQRPLEALLRRFPEHLWASLRAREGGARTSPEMSELEGMVNSELRTLEAEDSRLGSKLQFTDDGLAKRNREHFQFKHLRAEWLNLLEQQANLAPEELADRHFHLSSDVRTMITHTGDSSNLILDPDLDSYYLMDVTLLALPQMQDRLATAITRGAAMLRRGKLERRDQGELAVAASMLGEADLARVVGSARTALNEDANFYGTSPSLQKRLPPPLRELSESAESFIGLLQRLSGEEIPAVPQGEFMAAGLRAREASFALWKIADEELDVLLGARIDYYRARRARSLLLTAFALVAAIGFVGFITRSISNPLRKQARDLTESNRALQTQIQERERVEAALRAAEEKYRSIFENAVEGIFQTTPDGKFLDANPTLARLYGYASVAELQAGVRDIGSGLYVDPNRRAEFMRQMEEFGRVFRFESEVYRRDGSVIWISEHARAVRDSGGALLYYEGTVEDITERKRHEREMESVNKKLVEASRLAGMAEVATGVLHNVGNVLNSVNVSANFVTESLRKSRVANVPKVAGLFREHSADMGAFLTSDPKGRQIPGYIEELGRRLVDENDTALKKMELLRQHLDHIKEIVAMQQSYAKVSGVSEAVPIADLLEDALRLNAGALTRHQVEVERQYQDNPTVLIDKHKTLQIVVNLIRNAKYACAESERQDKKMILRISRRENRLLIAVADNGVGIPPENLVRIFNHGFTTRMDGHGFGLHSGALAAREMGGSLKAESAGPGQGATFTLDLPIGSTPASYA